ncbi:TPA: hypothetical protein DCE37_02190 [Candidatus Latescibacteria bacterium]|nr:hypothetical protein [Candidatus Latescibacterota bacterium]
MTDTPINRWIILPTVDLSCISLGTAYGKKGNFDRSIQFLETAQKLAPDYDLVKSEPGLCEGNQGRVDCREGYG